ncbi:hypothetical protein D3C77_337800 [compost metagenome]
MWPASGTDPDDAQLVTAELTHSTEPALHVFRLTAVDSNQDLIVAISGVFENRLDTAPQRLQVLAGGNNDGDRRCITVPVEDSGQHAVLRRYQFSFDTQPLQVRLQDTRRLGYAGWRRLPSGIVVLTLHQQLGHMLDHLQTMSFNQPPEQILRREHIIVGLEPSRRQ